jgi:hypothetical protein
MLALCAAVQGNEAAAAGWADGSRIMPSVARDSEVATAGVCTVVPSRVLWHEAMK